MLKKLQEWASPRNNKRLLTVRPVATFNAINYETANDSTFGRSAFKCKCSTSWLFLRRKLLVVERCAFATATWERPVQSRVHKLPKKECCKKAMCWKLICIKSVFHGPLLSSRQKWAGNGWCGRSWQSWKQRPIKTPILKRKLLASVSQRIREKESKMTPMTVKICFKF